MDAPLTYSSFDDILKERLIAIDLGRAELEDDNPVMAWANRHRHLPSSSAAAGKYRGSRTPYLNGVAEALWDNTGAAQIVACRKGVQLGFSELGVNLIGYTIDKRPVPILMVMDTGDKATAFAKSRIVPMFHSQPIVNLIKRSVSKGGRMQQINVQFPSGEFNLGGAGTTSTFSSYTVGLMILDEYARYPMSVKNEGDPRSLARGRLSTFGDRGKLYIPSTPVDTSDEPGSFCQLVDSGDCRQYFMPCPNCGHPDYFRKERFKYERTDDARFKAWMKCEGCGEKISEEHKTDMLAAGFWQATKKPDYYGIVSFIAPAFLSPIGWLSWESIASEHYLAVQRKSEMKTVYNIYFGEPYDDEVPAPDVETTKREFGLPYDRGTCPSPVRFLTLSADVQHGWMKWEVKGWAAGMVSYSIDYGIIDHNVDTEAARVGFEKILYRKWPHANGGTLPIYIAGVDSGDQTAEVYNFVAKYRQPLYRNLQRIYLRAPHTVIALRGESKMTATQIISRVQQVKHKQVVENISSPLCVWFTATQIVKSSLYSALATEHVMGDDDKLSKAPPGSCFFPDTYPLTWFDELVSERVILKKNKVTGIVSRHFYKPDGVRNEALDLHVMNRMLAQVVAVTRLQDEDFTSLFIKFFVKSDDNPVSAELSEMAKTKVSVNTLRRRQRKRRELRRKTV